MMADEVGTSYRQATAALAGRVLVAVQDNGGVNLTDFLDSCGDVTAAMGAVRLVGADVFVPQSLLNRPVDTRDVEIVESSFSVFPPTGQPSTPEQRVMAWRDWATGRLLARLTERNPPAPAAAPGTIAAVLGDPGDWRRWSIALAQLSSLAQPDVCGPVIQAVEEGCRSLSRGATRAVLRRDHPMAARLARWVALLAGRGGRLDLDPGLLIEHIRLHAGTEPSLLLDLAVARQLLDREPS